MFRMNPRTRECFVACRPELLKHETLMTICNFLRREGCVIVSKGDFERGDYAGMQDAIERCAVFICVLDDI